MDELRASDAEREATVARLHAAATAGRLDAEELDERVTEAYRARTRADLTALTRDLPDDPPPRREVVRANHNALELRRRGATALTAAVVAVVVWLVTGAGYFWPQWVLLGVGLSLLGPLIRLLFKVDD